MQKLLTRLARQLDAIDEASLMDLWGKYATVVSRFEPTKEWEEAAIVFSLIQAKRWKNQLFNYHWARQTRLTASTPALSVPLPNFQLEDSDPPPKPHRCRILPFSLRPDSTPQEEEEPPSPQ